MVSIELHFVRTLNGMAIRNINHFDQNSQTNKSTKKMHSRLFIDFGGSLWKIALKSNCIFSLLNLLDGVVFKPHFEKLLESWWWLVCLFTSSEKYSIRGSQIVEAEKSYNNFYYYRSYKRMSKSMRNAVF